MTEGEHMSANGTVGDEKKVTKKKILIAGDVVERDFWAAILARCEHVVGGNFCARNKIAPQKHGAYGGAQGSVMISTLEG